jgi:hypothetical protein
MAFRIVVVPSAEHRRLAAAAGSNGEVPALLEHIAKNVGRALTSSARSRSP